MGRSARLRRAPLHGLRAFGTSPMRGCGPSPLRRDPLGPGSGGSPQGWAGSGSRPRSGAPGPLPRGGPACAVRGAPVPGAGAPRATRPAPLASVVCGRSPGAPACGRGRRGPLFGLSSLAVRPVASYLGPVPGSLVGPGRPSASPAGVPPGSTARPPAASFLRPRGAALCVPAPAGPPSLRCGLPVVALPPLLRAVRRRARSPGPPLRRPLRAVLAAVQMGVGSVGLLRPGALAGPRSPRWGGRGPVCVALRPGAFCAAALLGGSPPALGPPLVLRASPGAAASRGLLPFPLPAPPPPLGEGEGTGPDGWQAPREARFSRASLGPPAPSGRCPDGAAPRR